MTYCCNTIRVYRCFTLKTRVTLFPTWLQMRAETVRRNSGVKGYQSAVMPSLLHTARRPTT